MELLQVEAVGLAAENLPGVRCTSALQGDSNNNRMKGGVEKEEAALSDSSTDRGEREGVISDRLETTIAHVPLVSSFSATSLYS